ncbi:MAG: hypothetical protein EHM24_21900 [Acidobacteria bacterium]|nr:MAG: hypothetical protein EHM24_21900 [Acidobacteriota bacterium]
MITLQFSRAILFLTILTAAGAASQALATAGQQPPASPQPIATQQAAAAQKPAPAPGRHGVRNFTSVDSTFACGGALSEGSMAALKEAGFVTVVNLRAATEDGANIDAEIEAAKSAGIRYAHLPFVSGSPDAAKVDEFLKTVTDPASQPVFLHCASGGRASMFWAIKRVLVDGWTVEKAMAELPDLSKNVGEALKTFTLEYIKSHRM